MKYPFQENVKTIRLQKETCSEMRLKISMKRRFAGSSKVSQNKSAVNLLAQILSTEKSFLLIGDEMHLFLSKSHRIYFAFLSGIDISF